MTFYRFLPIVLLFQSCFKTPVEPKNENELLRLWDYTYEIVGDAAPVISGDTIYASGGLYLFALKQSDGSLIWQSQIDNDSELKGQKLLLKENQIVANHRLNIRGWNKKTGELQWQFDYPDGIEPRQNGNHSVTSNGYAFAAFDRKFFILDTMGKLILTKQMDRNYGILGITYANNRIYLGQRNAVNGALTLGRITTLNAETGDSLWAFDTDQGGFTWTAPIVENSILYASTIGNSDGEIAIALNAVTGEEIWRQTNNIFTFNSAIGPTHFYINTSGSLAALDKQTGNIDWRVEWSSSAHGFPVYLEGYVYFSNYSELMVINDDTGEVVHREPVPDGGGFFWHVAASSDKIFAQTSRQLIAYQPWHLRK